jgi:hypothetical protein
VKSHESNVLEISLFEPFEQYFRAKMLGGSNGSFEDSSMLEKCQKKLMNFISMDFTSKTEYLSNDNYCFWH